MTISNQRGLTRQRSGQGQNKDLDIDKDENVDEKIDNEQEQV